MQGAILSGICLLLSKHLVVVAKIVGKRIPLDVIEEQCWYLLSSFFVNYPAIVDQLAGHSFLSFTVSSFLIRTLCCIGCLVLF